MLLERGGEEWRRTYLVSYAYSVSIVLSSTNIDTGLLDMSAELILIKMLQT
jgi:hypothetical protein